MMAQAPKDQQEQAPRKTTTYKQFDGMNSQDERYGAEKTEFFFLENIMRVGDGKLRSVSGPTAALASFPVAGAFGFLLLQSGGYLRLQTGGRIRL